MNFLHGYKTYIQAILIGVASGVHYMGWIDVEAYILILGLLGAGTVASLRHSVKTENTITTGYAETNPDNEAE